MKCSGTWIHFRQPAMPLDSPSAQRKRRSCFSQHPTQTTHIQPAQSTVDKFVYLGSTLSTNVLIDDDVDARIAKASTDSGSRDNWQGYISPFASNLSHRWAREVCCTFHVGIWVPAATVAFLQQITDHIWDTSAVKSAAVVIHYTNLLNVLTWRLQYPNKLGNSCTNLTRLFEPILTLSLTH